MKVSDLLKAIHESERKILAYPHLRPSVRLKIYRIFTVAMIEAHFCCN
jgi:hypothetical protein